MLSGFRIFSYFSFSHFFISPLWDDRRRRKEEDDAIMFSRNRVNGSERISLGSLSVAVVCCGSMSHPQPPVVNGTGVLWLLTHPGRVVSHQSASSCSALLLGFVLCGCRVRVLTGASIRSEERKKERKNERTNERKKERKKEERAERKKSPSKIACTGTFCDSRA